MSAATYTIIAYPKGRRTTVATLHGNDRNSEAVVVMGAMRAGVSAGSELDGIVAHATMQAKVRGEYVDVYRKSPGRTTEDHIATVGESGPVQSL